jgi:hypothetical protein
MVVYVDSLIHRRPGGRKRYCHMTADTLEELHLFAEKIGRKRCWFERSRNGTPHYDLDEESRRIAVLNGAVEKKRLLHGIDDINL